MTVGGGVELRKAEASDAATFAAWELDPVFCAHNDWSFGSPQDESIEWWTRSLGQPDVELTRLVALVEGEVVGYVDLHGAEADIKELGYAVAPSERWGTGMGTALARTGLAYGFEQLRLERIWAEAIEANAASVRILERVGMREIGPGEPAVLLGQTSRYRRIEISRVEFLAAAPG
ncbi:N-acetyltransferase [Galactobacter valiniphilus]|uniref:N-acetyltransferase n=1 Tax=Galactobacter valiniphilus TaxID=2676122 RepID=A0A399JAT1_9MICC|nr:GNAT family N-acetyltransferase [Galactobacter valiniphilus]RII42648.1 N-acetyltransferase [Galactobacter valiniphilus]